jgi:hypothetical protein
MLVFPGNNIPLIEIKINISGCNYVIWTTIDRIVHRFLELCRRGRVVPKEEREAVVALGRPSNHAG